MLRYGGEHMNLISKKDLLAITGISYGQLYRWKRERLIPEEWFIKQSAYTGQETFFPREQILSRVQSIIDLKDKYSLEELAKILSSDVTDAKIPINDLQELGEIDQELSIKLQHIFHKDKLDLIEAALIIAISETSKKIGFNKTQCEDLLIRSISGACRQKSTNISCIIIKVCNEYHTIFTINSTPILFDDGIEVVDQINLSEIADKIKIKYKNNFI